MNFDILRQSILEKAIQGKLVPQLDSDPAVEQIGDVPEDVPFAIPEKWKWVRLNMISTIVRGGSPRPIKSFITDRDDGLNWIKIGDAERGVARISSCAEKIIPDGLKKTRFVKKGSLLLTNSMSFGYPYILDVDGCIHDGWLAFSDFESFIERNYLYYVFLSPYCRAEFVAKAAGAVVKNLNIDKVKQVSIPLPPLSEQRRIVAKVNALFEQIDLAEKAHKELAGPLSDRFRALVLEQAIQGKLVPQLDSEPAVDQIGEAPEDVPFEIPEKWKWFSFQAAVQTLNAKHHQIKSKEVLAKGSFPVISQSKHLIDGYCNEEQKLIADNLLPIIVFGDHTRVIKIITFPFVVGADGTKLLRSNSEKISTEYLFLVLSALVKTTRDRGYSRHFQFLSKLSIPVPPLPEQRRIVARVEALLKEVDAIAR